ncbi:MAG: transposase [Pyrinomonadaceae bacterium]|nr:transposase [Sphingobacteriaceae bacterium]
MSDYEAEQKVNDSLSFMKFVDLTLEDDVPDNTVLNIIAYGFIAVSIESNTTYFWKTNTRDSKGNISGSAVYQFKVLYAIIQL